MKWFLIIVKKTILALKNLFIKGVIKMKLQNFLKFIIFRLILLLFLIVFYENAKAGYLFLNFKEQYEIIL